MKKRVLALALGACTALPLVGCGGNKVKTEVNTVNIMMVNSGYGTAWVEDAKTKFEALYANEGYKINLLPAKSTFQGNAALGEIRLGYEKTGYDMVISSGYTVQQLTDESYGVAVEPLTDVMTSQAIGFDGTLGEGKIEELYNSSQSWRIKIGDTYWGVPYASESRGLVCNMKVLDKYGITEMPATTDELFESFNTVYNGANGKTGMRPVVWGGANAYGYALPTLYNSMAQLMGVQAYEEFYSLNGLLNADGTIKADGYKHVDNANVREAIKITMQSFDTAYSLAGSLDQPHTDAHAAIITGKAAFMFDGNFFFNEVRENFPSYLKDVRFCLLPVPSKLGVDLQLDGSGADRAKCDDILSFMVKKVDEGKSAAEIKSLTETQFSVALTDEKVNRVVEARTTGNGGAGFLNVVKGSPNAEIAKLFIRMLLSEDASKEIYAKYGMLSPTYSNIEINSEYQFIVDTYKAKSVTKYETTSQMDPSSIRAKTNLFVLPGYNAMFPVDVNSEMGFVENVSARNYDTLADTIFNKVTTNARDKWASHMSNGGYSLGN